MRDFEKNDTIDPFMQSRSALELVPRRLRSDNDAAV